MLGHSPIASFPVSSVYDYSDYRYAGVVSLEGSPAQADLYLVNIDDCVKVVSDPTTGTYRVVDSAERVVIPSGATKLFMLCDYGDNVLPLTHGPLPEPVLYDPFAVEAEGEAEEEIAPQFVDFVTGLSVLGL